jgi:glycerol-3-phosphate dehydrogenase (NAD(P)+)
MRITIIGAGSWGTALGLSLHRNGHKITMWGHDARRLDVMKRVCRNEAYLPGVNLPPDWAYDTNLAAAVRQSEALVMAVPSKAFRKIAEVITAYEGIIVSVTKGIEAETCLTMTGILAQAVPGATGVALSGPSMAAEVAAGSPTAVVAAHKDPAVATTVQTWFHRPAFRVYSSTDPLGVELGGALKNVIAIGAGVCDGLGLGDNSKAALITRAIVEITRIGAASGAEPSTFAGLSGLGDLMLTCFSKLSRNRAFGERIGRGEDLTRLVATMMTVAEGYPTARSARQLAFRLGVETPIIDQVYAMLYEGKNIREGIQALTSRDSKPEK